jgi:aquaporin Z
MSKRLAAEFIGTLWLVLGGCGSAVLAATFPTWGSACTESHLRLA